MKPLPVSWTTLSGLVTCARQFFHIKVAKDFKEEKGEAALWGDYVHKAFERRIKYGEPLPEDIAKWEKLLAPIPKDGAHCELKLAMTREFKRCDFFAKDVFMRCIIDFFRVSMDGSKAKLIDWKTGKRKVNNQLMFSALIVFYLYTHVDEIETLFVWLQDGVKPDRMVYKREEIPEMWAKLMPDLRHYRDTFHTGVFPPTPSGLCRGWCIVKTCEHWRPKR